MCITDLLVLASFFFYVGTDHIFVGTDHIFLFRITDVMNIAECCNLQARSALHFHFVQSIRAGIQKLAFMSYACVFPFDVGWHDFPE